MMKEESPKKISPLPGSAMRSSPVFLCRDQRRFQTKMMKSWASWKHRRRCEYQASGDRPSHSTFLVERRSPCGSMGTWLVILLLLLIVPGVLWARDARQEKRIEHLLQTVESLKGAAFIRNGTEYNAGDAGKHLRMKLSMAGARVKTAEDFIKVC